MIKVKRLIIHFYPFYDRDFKTLHTVTMIGMTKGGETVTVRIRQNTINFRR